MLRCARIYFCSSAKAFCSSAKAVCSSAKARVRCPSPECDVSLTRLSPLVSACVPRPVRAQGCQAHLRPPLLFGQPRVGDASAILLPRRSVANSQLPSQSNSEHALVANTEKRKSFKPDPAPDSVEEKCKACLLEGRVALVTGCVVGLVANPLKDKVAHYRAI